MVGGDRPGGRRKIGDDGQRQERLVSGPIDRARALVDEVHAADPSRAPDGRGAELVYADRMEAWVRQLVPDADELLRLAARCQHLERWSVPRDEYPMDRDGYNAWRRTLYDKQAERARELLLEAGVDPADADEVATWVAKKGLRRNPGTQALEDAACMVFLEHEIAGFAAKHPDYTREKMVRILDRIWKKMSPGAREAALALPGVRGLIGGGGEGRDLNG